MNTQLVNIPKTLLPLILAASLGSFGPSLASATSVSINPSKDNTLYEYVAADGDRSNALGDHFFAGKTALGYVRRGVLAFDIAGTIPPGSTITSVSLSMSMSRTLFETARTIELHTLVADWGEGASNANGQEGDGAPATANDATWRHRFYDTIFWTVQGRGLFHHGERKPVGWRNRRVHLEFGTNGRGCAVVAGQSGHKLRLAGVGRRVGEHDGEAV
jgi:hypothetical protein